MLYALAGKSEFLRLAQQHLADRGVIGRRAELAERRLVVEQACPQARQPVTFGHTSRRFLLDQLCHMTAAAAGRFRKPAVLRLWLARTRQIQRGRGGSWF